MRDLEHNVDARVWTGGSGWSNESSIDSTCRRCEGSWRMGFGAWRGTKDGRKDIFRSVIGCAITFGTASSSHVPSPEHQHGPSWTAPVDEQYHHSGANRRGRRFCGAQGVFNAILGVRALRSISNNSRIH